jgi:hypothetical protein
MMEWMYLAVVVDSQGGRGSSARQKKGFDQSYPVKRDRRGSARAAHPPKVRYLRLDPPGPTSTLHLRRRCHPRNPDFNTRNRRRRRQPSKMQGFSKFDFT